MGQRSVRANPDVIATPARPGGFEDGRPAASVELLLQPHGFEGLGMVGVTLLSNDLSRPVERLQDGEVLADRHAAAHAAGCHSCEKEEPVAKIDQLFRLDSHRLPGAAPVGVKLAEAVNAPVAWLEPER